MKHDWQPVFQFINDLGILSVVFLLGAVGSFAMTGNLYYPVCFILTCGGCSMVLAARGIHQNHKNFRKRFWRDDERREHTKTD